MMDTVTTDRQQTLRIRRFLMACASYLLWGIICISASYVGLMRVTMGVLLALGLLAFLANLAFYGLFASGLNRRLKDPSLTAAQMIHGILWVSIMGYYSHTSLRGSYIALYLIVFVFGVFKLRLRAFFALTFVAVASYGASMLLLAVNAPDAVDPHLEITRTVLLLAVLMWFSPLGYYIYNLRARAVQANIELKEALGTIEQLAVHDELTNVYNRRQMFRVLNREKAFADRTGMPFVACLMDLDDFKQINDTYGHLSGDTILRAFAQTIKHDIRREDYIFRYGGEEFLVIFTGTRCLANSADCAQRLRAATARLAFPDISDQVRVTISIGMTTYDPGETIDSLLSRADAALYKAKKNGKNRVEYTAPPRRTS